MKKKLLIVSAKYYREISKNLINGATEYLDNQIRNNSKISGYEYEHLDAPGCFEIPYLINKNKNHYEGFIALGCVIKGQTYHFELISNEVTRKIMDLNISINKPIGFGILTCENIEQAKIRSAIDQNNKGAEAAEACIAMLIHKNHG